MGWLGYKSHFTETVSDPAGDDLDPGRAVLPNLVTNVQTTHAAVPDVAMTGVVHDRLEAAGLLPASTPPIPGMSPRTCWCPPGSGASPRRRASGDNAAARARKICVHAAMGRAPRRAR